MFSETAQPRPPLVAPAGKELGSSTKKTKHGPGKMLVVEDSEVDQALVERALDGDFEVKFAKTGIEALHLLNTEHFDMAVLDVMLPDIDGFTLCEQIKLDARNSRLGIVFLTVKNSTPEKVKAFAMGCDDYIEKPFEPQEFRARLQAHLRRHLRPDTPNQILKGPFLINLTSQEAFLQTHGQTQELHLTPIEFKLLCSFTRNEHRVLPRKELLAAVWGKRTHVLDRTIDKHVCSLREKLGATASTIQTVSRAGYRFVLETD